MEINEHLSEFLQISENVDQSSETSAQSRYTLSVFVGSLLRSCLSLKRAIHSCMLHHVLRIITSAKENMCYLAFVCLSVCLSVF